MAGIYAWIVSEENRMFYIGQSISLKDEKRASRFKIPSGYSSANPHTKNVLAKAKRECKTVIFIWLERFLQDVSETVLNEAETYWIHHYRQLGEKLCNADNGGGNRRRTPLWCASRSAISTEIMSRPHIRNNLRNAANRLWADPVKANEMISNLKIAMQRPDIREKQLAGIRSKETQKKKSAGNKRRWDLWRKERSCWEDDGGK